MVFKIILFLSTLSLVSGSEFSCYWNNNCVYKYFGSKTPYDTVRGDFRDAKKFKGCQAVSLWSLHRHGNRSPRIDLTRDMKTIADLKAQIVEAYDHGRSLLCAQDIDDFRKWTWNDTFKTSHYLLTGVGYEEMYNIGARVKAAFPELMTGMPEEYYFRPADKKRALQSGVAYVDGLRDGSNISLTIVEPREIDDIIRPFDRCPLFASNKRNSSMLAKENDVLQKSPDYVAIKNALQKRLGIFYKITTENVSTFYEICRYYRSWDPHFRSPWCAVFSKEDLIVLQYKDDLKHYYIHGYGSPVVPSLGKITLRNLYDTFKSAVQGQGKKMVTYFTHGALVHMTCCALGLYKDTKPLRGAHRDENRLWKTSFIAPMAINFMAVLYSCQESDIQTYRVQIFVGEKVTPLCPEEGCSWHQFEMMLRPFANASLDHDLCLDNIKSDVAKL